jgi:hypothetical protein
MATALYAYLLIILRLNSNSKVLHIDTPAPPKGFEPARLWDIENHAKSSIYGTTRSTELDSNFSRQ